MKSDVEIEVEVEAENGVYAVTADGNLIDYNTADESCIGVAFISDNQKVIIPKENATDGTNTTLFWGYNLYGQDVPNLEYLVNKTAAKADYNGKANTAAIIAGYAALGKDMNSRDMCKVLETYNEGGYTDWYVPAAGQLYEFYSNKAAINEALAAISGTEFKSNYFWSSSERAAGYVWHVYFGDGNVGDFDKRGDYYVRFVRDLSVSKPLKERISDLESSKQDKLISGSNIKTINGTSILGSGDIMIESNSAYTEMNHGTSDTTFTLTSNTFHVWDEVVSLDLLFADETEGVANEYLFQFTSGATPTSLTLPDTIQWVNGAPSIEANKTYQVSIVNNIGLIVRV